MKLSMLGKDYGYGLAPVSGGYVHANGRGYISPTGQMLGAVAPFEVEAGGATTPLQAAANEWLTFNGGPNMTNVPSSIDDPSLVNTAEKYDVSRSQLYDQLKSYAGSISKTLRRQRITQGLANVGEIAEAATKGIISVVQAIQAIKNSSATEEQKNAALQGLQWKQYLPWIIGGGG